MHKKSLQAPMRAELVVASVSPEVRETVARIVHTGVDDLVEIFYSTLLRNQDAARFLSHKIVDERLHRSLRVWLLELFANHPHPDHVRTLAERQRVIGDAHARMRIPIHLVMQGVELLKAGIFERLQKTGLERNDLWQALIYTTGLMDWAIEHMSQTYVRSTASRAQTDEAYRLFSLGQDVTLDRESQRAVLMEWALNTLFNLYGAEREAKLSSLSKSDFGLWLRHRAGVMFEGSANLANIEKSVLQMDEDLLPRIRQARATNPSQLPALLEKFQEAIAEMKFLLADMFQSVAAIENGRDPLTKALNRRFLPSILSREIVLAAKNNTPFSVLMIDVDHFKQINDTWGHAAGDTVLRQVADAVLDTCRMTDFVFRYGGEEFLVALVEADEDMAFQAAERIRLHIAMREFLAPDGTALNVSISGGIASFDGHPDYSRLVEKADRALYTAKRNGRNRVVIADREPMQQAS